MRDPALSWQKTLAQGFASSQALLEFLGLPVSLANTQVEQSFRTRVPRGFANRMQVGNPQDPLLLQVLAQDLELVVENKYGRDPLAETKVNPIPGLLHKYHGRVLLTLTGSCAVNCRYCFRRHFPYKKNTYSRETWQSAFEYIRQDPSIHEVILSGGDPLLAADQILASCFKELSSIKHLRTLRFHTRIPIVLPERITASFLSLLAQVRLRKVIVLHCNHAQEIDASVYETCRLLRDADCTLLNQSVLLKGINDSVEALVNLSERLFDCGVLPYYLHLLDKVAGAAHFDMPEETALKLFHQLETQLPGYLLPKLVREESGKASKTLLV